MEYEKPLFLKNTRSNMSNNCNKGLYDTIDGKYNIIARLGMGSEGEVI